MAKTTPVQNKAENELEFSNRFQAIIDSSDDAIISKTLNGIVTSWNKAAESIFGYSAVEMIGEKMLKVFPADRLEEEDKILSKIERGETIEHFKTIRLHKSGRLIYMSVSISPIRDRSDKIIGASTIARDISRDIESERNNEKLSAIVTSSEDAIISKSLDGTITSWNHAAEVIFGYTEAEMLNEKMLKLFPPDRQDEEDIILAQITQGKSIEHFRTVRLRKDGQLIHVSVSISPIHDTDGNIVGAATIARDISQEVAYSNELIRYKALVESSIDAIVSETIDGKVQTWNQAAQLLFGYTRDEIIGQSASIFLPKDKQNEEQPIITALLQGKMTKHYRTMRLHKNGDLIHVSIALSAVYDVNNQICGYSKIIRDISKDIEKEAIIKKQATYDGLTQLRNRSSFTQYVKQLIPITQMKGNQFALLFIDVDDFKAYNDSFGHSFGDKILVHISQTLKSIVRSNDEVARLGGDEFVICLTGITTTNIVKTIAEKIIHELNKLTQIEDQQVSISISIGAAIYPQDAQSFESMLRTADHAMYFAKRQGKNQFYLYSESKN